MSWACIQQFMFPLQRQLEQQPLGELVDMGCEISPGTQPHMNDDDSDFSPELLAVSALDQLVNSPPPSQPLSNQVKRVCFHADEATCQAGATLTGLGAVAHGSRADFTALEEADANGGPAQQQKKKRGRPKVSKTKRKAEAAGAASAADSAPKDRSLGRPSAKKRKKGSDQTAAGPSDPAELHHHNDPVNSPVRASSSQAPMTSLDTSAPQDTGPQSRQGPPPSSSLQSLAASIAASVRLPPLSKQQSAPQAQQPRQQLPQQSAQQLQQHLQQQPKGTQTTAAGAAPHNSAAEPDTEYLQSAMDTIHQWLERSDSD